MSHEPITIMSQIVTMFFFFQAEDGIRDLTVTGVQTCALPILFLRLFDGDGSARLFCAVSRPGGGGPEGPYRAHAQEGGPRNRAKDTTSKIFERDRKSVV